jgi:hypothetical protein
LVSGVAEAGAAATFGSLLVAAAVGCEGLSLADGLLEQPATSKISAAATTRCNNPILISSVPNMNRASICG